MDVDTGPEILQKTRHATVMMDLADEDERMRRINQIYAFVPGNT